MVLKIIANLNGGDLVTSNNELTYKIYGSSDNFSTPIATLGSATNDEKVIITNGVVTINNVDVGTENNFKITAIDSAGNESELSESAFDPAYQAVLDFATSESYTLPTASQQIIGNALVIKLKSLGVWNKLGSLAMFATVGDDGFSLIDWKRLSKMTIEGSPVRTENEGWKGNGTDGAINSGFKLQDLTQFDLSNSLGSFGGWAFEPKATFAAALCGDKGQINEIVGGGNDWIQGTRPPVFSSATGLFHMNIDGTNAKQFINGVESATATVNTPLTSTEDFKALHAVNSDFSTDKIAILFVGGDLSTGQNDFYNALKTYMDAI
jgi:hypothetical protein